ncbi:MAG: hypothetical protein ACRDMZ_10460 [Solirubrobacteraceae bacterium]
MFGLVIVPVVVTILIQLLRPISEIRAYADDIADHGGLFGPHLGPVGEELARTRELVKGVNGGVVAYIAAIDKIR